MCLAILADQRFGLRIRQVFDALLGAKMEFDPGALVAGVNKTIGMAAEAMHMAKGTRDSTLAHDNGDLVQGLGQQGPEVPVVIRASHPGARISLDSVVEVGKAQGITEKEHWRIVAN